MVRTLASEISERQRLAVLHDHEIMDSGEEQAFDDLVALASAICSVPVALLTLIDRDRQWFKARHGTHYTGTPREISFCNHAIEGDGIFIVPDAALDLRFADNPLVTGDPHIRFYAGVPLAVNGHALGTLCVIDRVPRELTELQREGLAALGRQARAQLELRRNLRELADREASLVRQREHLAAAEIRKQELADLIVHDLKGPLSAILPCSELLLEDTALSPDAREAADAIHSATENMHRMVLDLMDVSASEHGTLVPRIEDVSLAALLDDLERTMVYRCIAAGRQLEVLPPAISVIRADRELVRRTLENLLDNAIKYAPGHSAIQLTHSVEGRDLVFRVLDDGPGIPEAERAQVFDKHVRLGRDRASHARTSRGLGLAFCRLAVEAHGGQIWIEDRQPHGSVFCVRLPAIPGLR